MAQTTSASTALTYGFPSVVLPLKRLPPLCRLPGQTPVQEARCFALGNWLISETISARRAAATSLIPGRVCKSVLPLHRVAGVHQYRAAVGQASPLRTQSEPECVGIRYGDGREHILAMLDAIEGSFCAT